MEHINEKEVLEELEKFKNRMIAQAKWKKRQEREKLRGYVV